MSHWGSAFPLERAACTPHPAGTASPPSLFLLDLRWAQPQYHKDPGLCWELCCDPVTGSRLAAQAGDSEWDRHSKTSANAALQKHLGPAGALQGWATLACWECWAGDVGQHLQDLVDYPVEDVPVHCRSWTRWPLKILSNPNYSMKAQNISLLNSGIKPTLWI